MKVEKMNQEEVREFLLLEQRQNQIKGTLLNELTIFETAEAYARYVPCDICPLFETCELEDLSYSMVKHKAHTECAEQLVYYMLGKKEKKE